MNKVLMVGRLAKDVDVRYTSIDNKLVASFSVALNRKSKDEKADFINCIAWEKIGDFINRYFRKGSPIGIVGRLQTRNYQDKDGKTVYVTEVIVEEAEFVGSKKDNEQAQNNDGMTYDAEVNDELPF